MTIPPKGAGQFLSLGIPPKEVADKTNANYRPGLNENVDAEAIRLNTLWDVDERLVKCVEALEKENVEQFTPDDLIDFFAEHGCADALVRWSNAEVEISTAEGKIPELENWRDALADGIIGLDSLMNLAGLNSFATDQKAMDYRVRQVLGRSEC